MKYAKAFAELIIGVKQMRKSMVLVPVFLVAVVALVFGVAALQGCNNNGAKAQVGQVEFDEAQLFFELNATDLDLGIHIFFDAEGWEEVEVRGPDGRIFRVENDGSLKEIGSTEVFSESEEPELDENNLEESIAAFLALFPEGEYEFSGTTVAGEELVGTAELTHDLPVAVSLDLSAFPTIMWTDNSVAGDPEIVGYEAIVELVVLVASEERVFEFSVDLPASATQVTVPAEFVELADGFEEEEIQEYKVEIIAIEANENKTITEESLIEE